MLLQRWGRNTKRHCLEQLVKNSFTIYKKNQTKIEKMSAEPKNRLEELKKLTNYDNWIRNAKMSSRKTSKDDVQNVELSEIAQLELIDKEVSSSNSEMVRACATTRVMILNESDFWSVAIIPEEHQKRTGKYFRWQ